MPESSRRRDDLPEAHVVAATEARRYVHARAGDRPAGCRESWRALSASARVCCAAIRSRRTRTCLPSSCPRAPNLASRLSSGVLPPGCSLSLTPSLHFAFTVRARPAPWCSPRARRVPQSVRAAQRSEQQSPERRSKYAPENAAPSVRQRGAAWWVGGGRSGGATGACPMCCASDSARHAQELVRMSVANQPAGECRGRGRCGHPNPGCVRCRSRICSIPLLRSCACPPPSHLLFSALKRSQTHPRMIVRARVTRIPHMRAQKAPALRGFIIENGLEAALMPHVDWAEMQTREGILFLFTTAGVCCVRAMRS